MASKAASQPAPTEEKAPKPVEPSKPEPSPPKPSAESQVDIPIGERIFASPIAKKIALERGIPLGQIKGSGPSGRIIRDDVEKYKPTSPTSTTTVNTPPPPSAQPTEYFDTPISNMRRTIGTRLTQSKQESPHYYLTVDVNMDKVMKLREVFNRTLVEKDKAAKLSVNDFIVKAVACALADVPEVNSAWLGEVIRT